MQAVASLFNLSIVVFVISTMVSMGLGLKVSQIIQPLKDLKLIIIAIVTNFLLVPLATVMVTWLIPVDEGTKIALIILSLSAGAPFIPKLGPRLGSLKHTMLFFPILHKPS